jgi:golgi-specific brefeldin A-resistance guanine nucleotide exchange factor 1
VERTIVGLLRISARLLRREELANEVLNSLRMLLLFKKKSIVRKLSQQVTFGLHDLLRTNAANIHSNDDWSNIFTILQVYGAGANPPPFMSLLGIQGASQQQIYNTNAIKTVDKQIHLNSKSGSDSSKIFI